MRDGDWRDLGGITLAFPLAVNLVKLKIKSSPCWVSHRSHSVSVMGIIAQGSINNTNCNNSVLRGAHPCRL